MTAVSPIVQTEKLSHSFGNGESRRKILFENTIALEPGEIAILTGPSGSGKTTLLTLIGALRAVQEGSARVLGRELNGLDERSRVNVRRDIGFIFQLHNLFESLTAYENVMMALELKPAASSEMSRRAKDMLIRVGLGNRLDAKPEAMSGGQRQRVSIARALVTRPKLVLADEPTAALDKESGKHIIELFQELSREEQCGVLIVTHDTRVLDAADRIINMVDGRITSDVRVRESVRICEFLSKCPVFAALSPAALTQVADRTRSEHYPAGTAIIRQGEKGDKFYIIRQGEAEVFQETAAGSKHIATLSEAEFFGEAALVTGAPRNATVTAKTAIDLYVLGKEDFREALASSASFRDELLRVLFQRQ